MRTAKTIRDYLRRLAQRAAVERGRPRWYAHHDRANTDFPDFTEACARFMATVSPDVLLQLLDDLDELEERAAAVAAAVADDVTRPMPTESEE
jgi:hypothetical protein